MDKIYRVLASTGLLLSTMIACGTAIADECKAVSGTAILTPDSECTITKFFPADRPQFLKLPNTCFSIQLEGDLKGSGFAGLTTEIGSDFAAVISKGGWIHTPVFIQETGLDPVINEFGVSETRQLFTARSVLDLQPGASCRVFTADAGVIDPTGSSAEQLLITGGEKRCNQATGTLFATGALFSPGGGFYRGTICLK